MRFRYNVVIISLLTLCIAVFLSQLEIPEPTPYPKIFKGYTIKAAVSVQEWNPNKPFQGELLALSEPVVLRNSVVAKWKAPTLWNLDYLLQHVPKQIKNVYRNNNRMFGPLWRSRKPMGQLSTLSWKNPHHVEDMDSKEFFSKLKTPKQGEYLYYTGNLNNPELMKDLQPFRELMIDLEKGQVYLWIGQANVTAWLHYDTYDNFFVQLQGRKRFLLFSPDQYRYVYEHPFLHPSFAQAQHNIEEPNLQAFPEASKAQCLEVDLEPGDLLYVPPMWYHQVTALTASISVSSWSPAQEQIHHDRVIHGMISMVDRSWDQKERRGVAKWIIESLTPRLSIPNFNSSDLASAPLINMTGKELVHYTLKLRYRHLIQTKELSVDELGVCESAMPVNMTILKNFLEEIIPIFQSHSARTRMTWLQNYVETLTYWGTGSGALAASFLSQCFN